MIRGALKRYERYKDSGVEWLGGVPEGWDVKRLKEISACVLTNGIFKKKDQFGYGVKLINVSDLYGNKTIIANENLDRVNATLCEVNRYCVKDGDIFFVRSSLKLEGVGASALFEKGNEETVFECHIIRLRVKQKIVFPKFAIYQLNSCVIRYNLIVSSKTVTMSTISQDKIDTIIFLYPSLPEQQAIAAYLDEKTNRIDRSIELLQAKADRYRELKKALITETVTRGLDPTVPMKDSGVEWIGEVPAHWEVKRIKEIATIFNGATPKSGNSINWDGDIYWVTTDDLGKLDTNEITDTKRKISKIGYESCGTTLCPVGSVVISGRAPIGHLAILGIYACTNQGCKTLVLNKNTNNRYLYYNLLAFKMVLESLGKGTTFIELSTKELSLFKISCPTYVEQQAIVTYLDTKTAQIDRIITAITTQIQTLQELRKNLINDVVTGKIKVV